MLNLGLYKGLSGHLLIDSLLNVGITRRPNLLDSISRNIGCLTDYSFNTGVLGVAWVLEWLTQNKYLYINTNEVLEEVDDNAYNIGVHLISKSNNTIDDILGIISYLQIRIAKVSSKDLYFRLFPLIECLKLLIKKLCNIAPQKIRCVKDFTTAATVLLRLSYSITGIIQEKMVEDYVYPTVDNIIDHISSSGCDHRYEEGLLKLSLFAVQFENHCWREVFVNALFSINEGDSLVRNSVDYTFIKDIVMNGFDSISFCQLRTGLENGLSVSGLCFLLTNYKVENSIIEITAYRLTK